MKYSLKKKRHKHIVLVYNTKYRIYVKSTELICSYCKYKLVNEM